MIGETIGQYRIIERLGEGGMGEVYLAEDLKLRRKAAVKIIAPHLTRDAARRQRFVQEALLAASIDHPHIAAIYDVDHVGDRTYIALSIFANNLPVRDGRARALMAQGHDSDAIQMYRDLLTPNRASKWTAMLEPRYVLALARLLEKTGQRDAARAEYRRFLELWKHADAGLPELTEARRGLSR